MLVFDVFALSLLVGLGRSGWRRGFTSAVTDLVGFTAALVLAVRLYPFASVAFSWALSPGWAAVAGGLAVFVPVIALTAVVGSKLGHFAAKPGLNATNRLMGLGFGLAWGVAVLTFVLLLAVSWPAPGWVLGALERSPAAVMLTDGRSPLPGLLEPLAERAVGEGRGRTSAPDAEAAGPRIGAGSIGYERSAKGM